MMVTSSQVPTARLSKEDYGIVRRNRSREVHLITGASGAGKTLLLTELISIILMRYHLINKAYEPIIGSYIFPRPLKVWSNYPVSFWYRPADDGAAWKGANRKVLLSTEDLDVEKLYTFHPDMREGTIIIDELDLIADRQDWASGGQKLLMAILRQVRKRHLSLKGTIQSINWLNPRFYFHIDYLTACRDSAVTAWGQNNNLEPGEITMLYTKDRSGLLTGYSYEETGKVHDSWFMGKRIHGFYDTDQEFNPFDHMISYHVKRKQKEIDAFADEREVEEQQAADSANKIIANVLSDAVKEKQGKMRLKELQDKLKASGLNIKRAVLQEHLQTVHNAQCFNAMGYPWVRLDNVTNVSKPRGRPHKASVK